MNAPIPHDIPLPLPAAEWFLKSLLVISFIAHIFFVNLLVGGSILSLVYEIRGKKRALYDEVAKFIAKTITVNKSMAVVLGVAPLLLINVLYTVWFYSANALTGIAWIMVIPLVAVAFLLTYLHKYTWDRPIQKNCHIGIMGMAVLIFLFIPLVFLANVNLMLFPDRWSEVHGFFSSLFLPNVFPRYFHFMGASLALTGLFLVWAINSKWGREIPSLNMSRTELTREFYFISLVVSGLQFVIGPIVLLTLPSQGLGLQLYAVIGIGAVFAVIAISLMWKEIKESNEIGRRVFSIAGVLLITIVCMASGRHFYRETALAAHKEAVQRKTAEYQEKVQAALAEYKEAEALVASDSTVKAKRLFQTCAACHSLDNRLVGPPIREIAKIYANNPGGIVIWAKAPGKKRPDYPQMPPMPLSEEELKIVAEYMLGLAR